MGQNFIADTVNPTLLLPPSLHDWLPEGDLARFFWDVVPALDLSAIYTSYSEKDGCGQAACAPQIEHQPCKSLNRSRQKRYDRHAPGGSVLAGRFWLDYFRWAVLAGPF